MISTNIEQAEMLVNAGVQKDSADMIWCRIELYDRSIAVEVMPKQKVVPPEAIISPAWSLGRLWDIIHGLDKTYDFETKMSSEELIEHLVTLICIRFEHR